MTIKIAEEKDLPGILELYSQPDMDNKQVHINRYYERYMTDLLIGGFGL